MGGGEQRPTGRSAEEARRTVVVHWPTYQTKTEPADPGIRWFTVAAGSLAFGTFSVVTWLGVLALLFTVVAGFAFAFVPARGIVRLCAGVAGPPVGFIAALPELFDRAAAESHGMAAVFLPIAWPFLLLMVAGPPVVAHLLGLALRWYVERQD